MHFCVNAHSQERSVYQSESMRMQKADYRVMLITCVLLFSTDNEDGAYEFKGTADSFVEIPNDGKMDIKNSMTILANVYPTGSGGPIVNYKTDGWGVHLWQFESTELFVRFVHRNGIFHKPLASRVLQVCFCLTTCLLQQSVFW